LLKAALNGSERPPEVLPVPPKKSGKRGFLLVAQFSKLNLLENVDDCHLLLLPCRRGRVPPVNLVVADPRNLKEIAYE
jgi:hypothetical protein